MAFVVANKQPSFAKGEIGPDLQGRIDSAIYAVALSLLRNFTVMRFGGVQNRPGSQFICRVKTSSDGQVKTIPFIFSQAVTYHLEFGNLYMRVVKNGAQVTLATKAITAITKANPGKVTAVAHGYATGDEAILTGILGMIQLNGRNVKITKVDNDNFTITDLDDANIDTTGFSTYTSGGTSAKIFELTTPYVTADLQLLNYVQSANVLTISHNNYPPADISRSADNVWTYTPIVFQPGIAGPSSIAFPTASGNAGTLTYQVTSVSTTTEESFPGLGASVPITALSQTSGVSITVTAVAHGLANGNTVFINQASNAQNILQIHGVAGPGVPTFTITAHGYTAGDSVIIAGVPTNSGIGFNVNPNGNWGITIIDANTITLNGLTTTVTGNLWPVSQPHGATSSQPYLAAFANATWVVSGVTANTFNLTGAVPTMTAAVAALVGGSFNANEISHAASGAPTATAPNILTWSAVVGAAQYNIYVGVNGIFGYIGTTAGLTFSDVGIAGAPLNNPPISMGVFGSPGNYPAVCCYYQQRLGFFNTLNAVATGWLSKSGARTNFTYHIPPQSGDAVSFTLVGNNEVNPILGAMDVRRLILFTAAGEWQIVGDGSGVLTAVSSPDARQCSSFGSTSVRPLLTNAEALYVQAQAGMIRNLEYKFTSDNYEGLELSLSANHLFQGYTITDWAYQKIPGSIIWAVRSDGQLLALTYLKEQQVQAWSHADFIGKATPTGGTFPIISSYGSVENVCCVPEGKETALYIVVNRSLYGSNIRYIERLSTRVVNDIKYANFMDAALTFDGTGPTTTSMQLSGGTGVYTDHMTLTASVATFTSANIGDAYFLYTVPTVSLQPIQQVRFVVDAFLSTTQVQGHVQGEPVPASLMSGPTTNWARAVNKVTGLWHLKSQAVSVFGDGYVIANPMNALYPVLTVDTNGNLSFDTDKFYSVITVGLPVTADFQTLDYDTASPDDPINQRMIVTSVSVFLRQSRGVWAGAGQPAPDAFGSPDTSQTNLERIPPRDADTDGYDVPHQMATTERLTQIVEGQWSTTGRAFLRVTDPLPVTILQVNTNGTMPPRTGVGK